MKYVLLIPTFVLSFTSLAQDSTAYWKSAYLDAADKYHFTEALRCAGHWATHDTLNPEAWHELAKTHMQKGAPSKAEGALRTLFYIDSTHISGLNLLAKIQIAAHQDLEAITTFERLMEIDSTNPYYPRKAALLCAKQEGMAQWQAYNYFNRTLALDSTDVETYVDFARYEIERKALYPADILLRKALDLDSTHQEARLTAARSAQLQGDYNDVIRLLKDMSFDLQYITTAARYYGIALFKTEDYQGAIATLTLITDIEPELDYPHYYIGLSHQALGEWREAIGQFELAIEKATSPNLPAYYQATGESYQALGDHKAAISQLRQADFLNGETNILYMLASSYDSYYDDKTVALNAYLAYLDKDTLANPQTDYARRRVDEIKKELHFLKGPKKPE